MLCLIISIKNNKRIMSPSVLAYGTFCLSTLIIILNYKYWNYEISIQTAITIFCGLFFFSIGTHLDLQNNSTENLIFIDKSDYLSVKQIPFAILVICCIIITIIYSHQQFKQSVFFGNTKGFTGMLDTLRHDVEVSSSITTILGICIVKATAIISIYLVLYNRYHKYETSRQCLRYYIPIACFLINCIFTSSRIGFIEVGTVVLFDYYAIFKMHPSTTANKMIVKRVVKVSCIVLLIFVGLGMLRDTLVVDWMNQLSIYVSSGIIGLDIFLKTNADPPAYFGQTTFRGIYNLLRMFGINIPFFVERHVTFGWNGNYSNIYTVFRPYIDDFGFIATYCIMMLEGVVFGNAWNCYIKRNNSLINILYGSYFGFALVLFAISEMMFRSFLAMNIFLTIGLEYIIFKFFLVHTKLKYRYL